MKVFTVLAVLILVISFPVFSGGQSESADAMEGGMMEAMEKPEVNAIVDFMSLEHAQKLADEKADGTLFLTQAGVPAAKGR